VLAVRAGLGKSLHSARHGLRSRHGRFVMAGRGPAPKGRRSRDRDTPEVTPLEVTDTLSGLPLPEGVLPDGEAWHPMTVRFWDALRRFPLLRDEPEIGWMFLIDTALMHHTMWTKGRWEFASELRLRVQKYGATPEDRMRLKIKIEVPPSASSPKGDGNVRDIASRRSRLTG